MVLDTNLFVAAYWNRDSASAKILESVYLQKISFLYSQQVKDEVYSVLKRISVKKSYLEYVDSIFAGGCLLKPRKHYTLIKDDPDDNKYIDCAVCGKAQFIISNDKHLLNLVAFKSISITTPSSFLQMGTS